jgi:hypothetical protein
MPHADVDVRDGRLQGGMFRSRHLLGGCVARETVDRRSAARRRESGPRAVRGGTSFCIDGSD